MTQLLALRPAGSVVTFVANRDGADRQIPVTLGQRPPVDKRRLPQFGKQPDELPPPAGNQPAPGDNLVMRPDGPMLGIRTLPITAQSQQQFNLSTTVGALVSFVGPGSPAEKAGLPLGAAIVAVDGQPVDSPQSLADLIRQSKAGQTVDLTCVIRGQELHKRVVLAAAARASKLKSEPSRRRRMGRSCRRPALRRSRRRWPRPAKGRALRRPNLSLPMPHASNSSSTASPSWNSGSKSSNRNQPISKSLAAAHALRSAVPRSTGA